MKIIPLLITLMLAATAHAEDVDPWGVGVSEEQKATAQGLMKEGNNLFVEKNFVGALDKYKEAIASWDHPAIRFNMVRCLIQLDRPVEAGESLKRALQYGAAPLEDTVYTEARAYEKLLASQIGELAVTCTQPNVRVTVDGQPFTTCPTPQRKQLAPGRHQIVATRDGYMTKTIDVFVVGGAVETVPVELLTFAKAGKIEHRWAKWVPWAVVGGGVVIGILAGSVQLKAQADMGRYRAAVDSCSTMGCLVDDLDTSTRDRALIENKIAIGMAVTGAAAVITGGVLLYMNRGRLVIPVEVAPARGAGAVVSVTGGF